MTEPTTRLGKFLWRLSGHEVDITPRNELEECLDAIASGSGGGGTFVIRVNVEQIDTTTNYTMDKTFAEIKEAMAAGKIVFTTMPVGTKGVTQEYVVSAIVGEKACSVDTIGNDNGEMVMSVYTCADKDGYPMRSFVL